MQQSQLEVTSVEIADDGLDTYGPQRTPPLRFVHYGAPRLRLRSECSAQVEGRNTGQLSHVMRRLLGVSRRPGVSSGRATYAGRSMSSSLDTNVLVETLLVPGRTLEAVHKGHFEFRLGHSAGGLFGAVARRAFEESSWGRWARPHAAEMHPTWRHSGGATRVGGRGQVSWSAATLMSASTAASEVSSQ